MDITKENTNPNPRDQANPLSKLFFTYTIGIFKKGYSKQLEVDDLYNPIKSDRSSVLGDRLERSWYKTFEKAKRKDKKAKLFSAIVRAFWPEYSILGLILIISDTITLIQPMMLGNLLKYFRPVPLIKKEEAYIYAGAIILITLLNAILINHYMMCGYHYGMKLRTAACALIYRKALRLSKTALGDTASGKIVNLLSSDVSRFDLVTILIHYMWTAPLATLIILYFLYVEAGYAGVIGIATVLIVVPLQGYAGKLSAVYRKATALKTDERIRLMDEIISGIQVIKMYAWEKPFTKLIKFARKAEIKIITKSSYVRGVYMTFNLFTTRLALFATLLTLVLSGEPITASSVFVIMSYLNIVSQKMSQMFVRGIAEIAELIVAIRRLQGIMLSEEYSALNEPQANNNANNINDQVAADNFSVRFQKLTVKWNVNLTEYALQDINMSVSSGQLLGVIGPVGSGKSSLLQTILGELVIISGKLEVNGSISYASQEPWVFASTIRQNILFGSELDKKRYNDVIRVCALDKDFEQFTDGDLTIVGDRGASLSGGQKARINLARAIYREADIYLLDDPLSAVDIHVSKHLYDLCINGYLRNKTRILVTHQVHHLKGADHILILKNGKIENEGCFKDLSQSDNLYAKLLTMEPDASEEDKARLSESSKRDRKMSVRSTKSSVSAMSERSILEALLAEAEDSEGGQSNELMATEGKVDLKDLQEESSKGKVKGSLFFNYLFAGGNSLFVLVVMLLFVLAQGAASGVDYFVSFWAKIEESKNSNATLTKSSQQLPAYYWTQELFLNVYGVLIFSVFIIGLLRSLLFYKLAMLGSQKLHDSMFSSIINSPMRFFDTNPSGRILNRFSKDIGSVDEFLPKAILDAGQIILMSAGAIILITVVNPTLLIVVGVVGVISLVWRHVFLRSSKNIKRLEGVMRSPAFTHLNATLQGLTTIRAFGAQNILRSEFDKHQDGHTSACFMYIATSVTFGFYMELLCFFFVAVITFSSLTFDEELGLSGGEIGLAITQSLMLTSTLQWGLRQSAEVTNQLMSVERVLEYKALPPEKQPQVPKRPPETWPDQGNIIFHDTGLRYSDEGDSVLKKLNLSIKAKEKVGIVGRTGAGKSSLIAALFRLATVEGTIKIDDIDTKDLTLVDLRSKISIIPQDPVLFSGTLRYNLDPFEEYTDDVLYKAIKDVELNDPANIINRLENKIMDKGSNYSVGQRQLICLARAIIRNNKILMLDEATANVDPQTDALIQKTLRKKFADCTVLTVAHRLNTIMDSDKVLVMNFGKLAEFDHPYLLLQDTNSIFYHMVEETGKALYSQLVKVAKDAYLRQHPLPE